MRTRLCGIAVVIASSFAPAMAHAQDAAAAEALFQSAHQLFEQKRFAEACPKFAESFRLDPVSGALLALAACHEAEGKLASAWAEYVDVATRARREGKNDRADAAQQRASALEPKLAKVTIKMADGAAALPDLQVKRDGVVVGAGTFGTPLPVDRGEHTVEASAPNRQAFVKRINVSDGANEVITIPVLSTASQVAPAPPAQPPQEGAPATPETPAQPATEGTPIRTAGIVTGVVGAVVMGVGGYFGLKAIGRNKESNENGRCVNDVCDPAGKTLRNEARSAGSTSTILFVTGGLLAATGVVLIIVGGPPGASDSKPAVALAPAAGPSSAGLSLSGSF